jgi:hypothetical protein
LPARRKPVATVATRRRMIGVFFMSVLLSWTVYPAISDAPQNVRKNVRLKTTSLFFVAPAL